MLFSKTLFCEHTGGGHGTARPGTAIAHLKPQLRKSLLFTRTHSFASQRIRNAFASHRNRTESDFPFRKLTHLQTPIYVHTYVCMYVGGWGVTSIVRRPQLGNRIRFGCGAMRCDCVAMRLRCDALRCEAVCACEEERFSWLVFQVGNGRAVAWRAVVVVVAPPSWQ